MSRTPKETPLAVQLAVATSGRLFLNTARRFPYPFATTLARGLGVPLPAITTLIAVSQGSAIAAPLFGPIGDRWGYRRVMVLGLGFLAAGMIGAGLWPGYTPVLVGVLLAALGKTAFDPAVQAYVASRVSLRRRGFAIGLIETAWSGSTLIGIPAVALLIDRFGWRAPFFVLGTGGFLWMLFVAIVLPDGGHRTPRTRREKGTWRRLAGDRRVLGALAFGFLLSLANDCLFVAYGAWLETRFGLGVVGVGTATMAIGVAELTGELGTALVADRLGLVRAAALGLLVSTVGYASLPVIGTTLTLALAGLFGTFLAYEFTIVTSFSLSTEIVPSARATFLGVYSALLGLGRMVGAIAGGFVWAGFGMTGIAVLATTANLAAFVALTWGFSQQRGSPEAGRLGSPQQGADG